MSELIGTSVQFIIGEVLVLRNKGNSLWAVFNLLLLIICVWFTWGPKRLKSEV